MPAMDGKEYKKKMEERRAAKPVKAERTPPAGPAVRLGGKEKKAQIAAERAANPRRTGIPSRLRNVLPTPPAPRLGGKEMKAKIEERKVGRPVPPKKRG